MQSHIEVAATRGMKAGYRAYREQLAKSGLDTVKAVRQQLDAMGNRAAFAWYCAKHGPDVTAFQVEDEPEVGVQVFADEPKGLTAEIAAARKRLAELEALASKPQAAPKPRRTRKAQASASTSSDVKENLWRAWAVKKHSIPTRVGATFAYKGKRRTSMFQVTRVTSEGVYSVRVA